jgi:hypothetical protein
MTRKDTPAHDTAGVLVRAQGDVSAEILAYVQDRIDTAVGRPGLPPITGEVRITRVAAHPAERPWSAVAEVRAGHAVVVVHAQEATGRELADRLRTQVEHAVHDGRADRAATAPPWRVGRTDEGDVRGSADG